MLANWCSSQQVSASSACGRRGSDPCRGRRVRRTRGIARPRRVAFALVAAGRAAPQGVEVNEPELSAESRPEGIAAVLEAARSRLARLTPAEAVAAQAAGALLVDIRPVEQRDRDGLVPGALIIDRNVLEWRLDPSSDHRIPESDSYDRQVVLLCNEGYATSLAAATLQDLGLWRATDVIGGFQRWRADGLPIEAPG